MRFKPLRMLLPMALVILVAVAVAAYSGMHPPRVVSPTGFMFNGIAYNFTSVAVTSAERQHGLMNYTITNTTFELFQFNYSADYPFWMKDTYYPLDMIWIEGNTVVYMVNATPCSWYSQDQSNCIIYDPHASATSVIEAKAGFVNSTGMKVGDRIRFV